MLASSPSICWCISPASESESKKTKSSSNDFPCAITFPSRSNAMLAPSKTRLSLPPTWFTNATGTRSVRAMVASISRRNSRFRAQKGEAEMLRTKLPPALTRDSTGSTLYRRRGQKCLSFQASSQIVSAICLPQNGNSTWLRAGAKFLSSSKTSYVGSNIFDCTNLIVPSMSSAAEFNTDLPVSACAGVTKPQMTAMPRVSAAICSAASRLC